MDSSAGGPVLGADAKMKRSCFLLLISPILVVASCVLINGPHPIWVRPEIRGRVTDASNGRPIAGAKIQFVNSPYGGGHTRSNDNGEFVLSPVSKNEWISVPGDPFYRTFVEASAQGYNSAVHETGHGTADVSGSHPAPIRIIDFAMRSDAPSTSEESFGSRGRAEALEK